MPKMKRTIAKILQAQTSMTAAKVLSATRPLPRLRRKSRICEGDGPIAASAGSGEWTAGALGKMGDIGCNGLGSRSSVIQLGSVPGVDCMGSKTSHNALEPVEKKAPHEFGMLGKSVRQLVLFDRCDALANHFLDLLRQRSV